MDEVGEAGKSIPFYVESNQGTVRFVEANPNDEAFQEAQSLEAY
jgi:hypothetical protein